MKRNLKKELREYYAAVPPMPEPDRMTELMARAGGKTFALPREDSIYWFIKTQLRFVSRKFLIFQLLLICLYGLFTTAVLRDNDGFRLLVPAAPIAVMLGTGELSRSFRFNAAELELPSRFSLPQILLARLTITAVADMLSLTCMLVLTAMKTYQTFGSLILYGLVPSLLAAAGALFLINRCRGGNAQYYVSAYCIALSALGEISLSEWPRLYSGAATAVWLLVLALSAIAVAAEVYRLLRDCPRRMEYAKHMEV